MTAPAGSAPAEPGSPVRADPAGLPPVERSLDDTDAGWGDEIRSDPDDDLRRYTDDLPPHWEP